MLTIKLDIPPADSMGREACYRCADDEPLLSTEALMQMSKAKLVESEEVMSNKADG